MKRIASILLSILLCSSLLAKDDSPQIEYIIRPHVGINGGFERSGESLFEVAKPSRKRVKEEYCYPMSIKEFFVFVDEFSEEEKGRGISILWLKGLVPKKKMIEVSGEVRYLGKDKDYEVFLVVVDLQRKTQLGETRDNEVASCH